MRNKRFEKAFGESSLEFLEGVAQKTRGLADHIDTQTNVLIGVSSAVFLFSLTRILEDAAELPFFVLVLFAGISALVGLLGIHPPRFMRKCGQNESLLYNRKIAEFDSAEEYAQQLEAALANPHEIVRQYAVEMYNLSKYYYRPKRRLFNLARNILLAGILISFFTLLFDIG